MVPVFRSVQSDNYAENSSTVQPVPGADADAAPVLKLLIVEVGGTSLVVGPLVVTVIVSGIHTYCDILH